MLFWPCKNASKHAAWYCFLVPSFLMHLLVLLLIFVIYRTDIVVLLVTTPQSRATAISFKSSTTSKTTRMLSKTANRPISQTKKNKDKSIRLAEQKKKIDSVRSKKMSVKEKKEMPKKELAQRPVLEQKQPELPKEIKPEPQPEPKLAQAPIAEKKEEIPVVQPIIQTTLAPIVIGEQVPLSESLMQDPFLVKQYGALQDEVSRHWKPPMGMQPMNTCHVSACVTNDGAIETLTITQSSGILVFDIAARKALLSSELPVWVKGKTITIVFK